MTKCILAKEGPAVDTTQHNAMSPCGDRIEGRDGRPQGRSEQYGTRLGSDRLLSITDVSDILGVCPVTASGVMKDTGRSVTIRRRVYILESNLIAFLRELEG